MNLAKQYAGLINPINIRLKWLGISALGLVVGLACPVWAIDPIKVEYLWLTQPKLDFDWLPRELLANVEVTVEQVDSDSARDRMQAAQSILRVPRSPLIDRPALLKALLSRLERGEPHRLVRIEMVAAACELDDGQNAERLWKVAGGDRDVEEVVQRASTRWRWAGPLERWRASLSNPAATDQDLLQAVDGLGAAGSAADAKLLEAVVLDGTRSSPLRLGSARALGKIATEDQMSLAVKLHGSGVENAQLLAVEVLARSPAPTATEFVQKIALEGPPMAQRSAYGWLCERDAGTAQRLVGSFLKHADAEVRMLALNQTKLAGAEDALAILFAALVDEHPQVREAARRHVLDCCGRSEAELQSALDLLKPTLDVDDWRGLEQSIRLTVELKQPSYCARLVALVEHKRPEVCITASWALRHLAEEEAVLHGMLDYVNRVTAKLLDDKNVELMDIQVQCAAHLFEAFGHRKFEPAKATALKFVPKNSRLGLITRMTAIWACGKLWEHGDNKQLIGELHARIADKASMTPEPMSLRFAATIALGWIADPESREPLLTWDEPKPTPIGYATEWALKRIEERK